MDGCQRSVGSARWWPADLSAVQLVSGVTPFLAAVAAVFRWCGGFSVVGVNGQWDLPGGGQQICPQFSWSVASPPFWRPSRWVWVSCGFSVAACPGVGRGWGADVSVSARPVGRFEAGFGEFGAFGSGGAPGARPVRWRGSGVVAQAPSGFRARTRLWLWRRRWHVPHSSARLSMSVGPLPGLAHGVMWWASQRAGSSAQSTQPPSRAMRARRCASVTERLARPCHRGSPFPENSSPNSSASQASRSSSL